MVGIYLAPTVAFTAFMVVGAVIVAHRPGNALGWIFSAIGLLSSAGVLAMEYAEYAYLTRPGSLPGAALTAWVLLVVAADPRPDLRVHAAAVPHRPPAVAPLAPGRGDRGAGDHGGRRPLEPTTVSLWLRPSAVRS
jgi:hypothetical protein